MTPDRTTELARLDRECAVCRSITDAGNIDYMWREQLKRWRLVTAEDIRFEGEIRARLAQLRAAWPTGYER